MKSETLELLKEAQVPLALWVPVVHVPSEDGGVVVGLSVEGLVSVAGAFFSGNAPRNEWVVNLDTETGMVYALSVLAQRVEERKGAAGNVYVISDPMGNFCWKVGTPGEFADYESSDGEFHDIAHELAEALVAEKQEENDGS